MVQNLNVKITFHEPEITQEENERRFKQVKEVLKKISIDMIKNRVTEN